jgi:hypothetical protein
MKIFLSLVLAAIPAFSYTITYDTSIPHLFQTIEVSVGGNVINVDAGQIGVRIDDTFPALMYCADPLTWLLVGPTPVSTITEDLFPNGGRIAWLYNTYNPTITLGSEAAALQLAIWEVVLDNNVDDLDSGQTQTTVNTNAQVKLLAGAMLQASASQTDTGLTFYVPDQGSNYSQTLLQSSAIALTQTPEPTNALLAGAGLLLMGALRRRKH